MSNQAIAAALAQRLSLLNLPTAYENAPFTPVAGQAFIAENFLPVATLAVGIAASSADNYGGIYQVTVHAPKGGTKGEGFAMAQQVQKHFPRGLTLTYQGQSVTILQASQGPSFVEGDRWLVPVSINYRGFA